MKTLLAAALGLCVFAASSAAQGAPPPGDVTPRNSVYVELLGNGGVYSFNYDRKLTDRVAVRIGAASWGVDDLFLGDEAAKRFVTVPVTASWLAGTGKSRVEVGGGVVFGRERQEVAFEDGSTSFAFTSLTGILGYRSQPLARGFMFRVGFTPFYGLGGEDAYPDSGFQFSLGLSGGYTF